MQVNLMNNNRTEDVKMRQKDGKSFLCAYGIGITDWPRRRIYI